MKQQGIILVVTLLIMAALSILVVAALTINRLEMQMSNNAADTLQELEAAEAGLTQAENLLSQKQNAINAIEWNYFGVSVRYTVEKLPESICLSTPDHKTWQRDFYRITSAANLKNVKPLVLQSTYALTDETTCKPVKEVPDVDLKRMSWCELE